MTEIKTHDVVVVKANDGISVVVDNEPVITNENNLTESHIEKILSAMGLDYYLEINGEDEPQS